VSTGGTSSAAGGTGGKGASGGGGTGGAMSGGGGGAQGRADASTGVDAGHDAGGTGGTGGRTYSTSRSDFFGSSRCSSLNALVCDGFETGKLDAAIWKTKFQAPTFDTTRAARGTTSLHLSTTATGNSGIETSKIFPATKNSYYGRMFVWFEALPTSPQWAHWTIVGANPAAASSITGEIRVGGQYDGKLNRFGVGTDGGPTGDWTNLDGDPKSGASPVPLGSWICVEWLHKGDTNETRFWWDGVEHPSLDTTRDTAHQGNASVKYDLPTFGSVWVGFWNYNQNKPVVPDHFDVWIDEVALDAERIGCSL
jgi:hypothetical protein